jgi:hypothetical protein
MVEMISTFGGHRRNDMKVKENLWVILSVIAIAVITRLIPHYPNFTALGAAALFGGAYLRRPLAFLIPAIALFLSDLFLNNLIYARQFPDNYDGFVVFDIQSLWSYGAMFLITALGIVFVQKRKILSIVGGSVAASVVFFLISNLSVWVTTTFYPETWSGLMLAYGAAIPFFWNTLAGDLFYCGVFFGVYALAAKTILAPQPAKS